MAVDDALRKDAKALINRLRSIKLDAAFIDQIAARFPSLKVIPNERCGLWYIDPSKRSHGQSVYFKSTDGHFGIWNFSLKRLNLHLLSVISSDSGAIIVDSTRSGKRFPDSLSKTIPIWCCVINTAVAQFRKQNKLSDSLSEEWDTDFHSLPSLLSPSEHQQIQSRIDQLAALLLSTPSVDLSHISSLLLKPLRPLWIAPDTNYFCNIIESSGNGGFIKKAWADSKEFEFYPVICVNASELSHDGCQRKNGFYYVQGAADDHEMWGMGLTPDLFWRHQGQLLNPSYSNTDCVRIAKEIVQQSKSSTGNASCNSLSDGEVFFDWIGSSGIAIGSRRSGKPPGCWVDFDVVINCGAPEYPEMAASLEMVGNYKNYLYLPIPEGKKGQHALYESIVVVSDFVVKAAKRNIAKTPKILIHCAQGRDRSVAITICLLMQFQTHNKIMAYDTPQKREMMNKKMIQDMLVYIQQFRPMALPSRAFMCRVNDYFLTPPCLKS
ncbi:tRNA A64-2'-O-ribosylphosphate transferase [Obelidium mucronatum]|nr:tRNA A64-2'-O-ribosylphosphate transferase [Obelidium mucronatum]